MLSNVSKKLYFIHVDVYQGTNSENINIPDVIKDLLTTQKVTKYDAFAIFL